MLARRRFAIGAGVTRATDTGSRERLSAVRALKGRAMGVGGTRNLPRLIHDAVLNPSESPMCGNELISHRFHISGFGRDLTHPRRVKTNRGPGLVRCATTLC